MECAIVHDDPHCHQTVFNFVSLLQTCNMAPWLHIASNLPLLKFLHINLQCPKSFHKCMRYLCCMPGPIINWVKFHELAFKKHNNISTLLVYMRYEILTTTKKKWVGTLGWLLLYRMLKLWHVPNIVKGPWKHCEYEWSKFESILMKIQKMNLALSKMIVRI